MNSSSFTYSLYHHHNVHIHMWICKLNKSSAVNNLRHWLSVCFFNRESLCVEDALNEAWVTIFGYDFRVEFYLLVLLYFIVKFFTLESLVHWQISSITTVALCLHRQTEMNGVALLPSASMMRDDLKSRLMLTVENECSLLK